jgi:hypothetical protein
MKLVNLEAWCLKHDAPGAARGMLEGRLATTYSHLVLGGRTMSRKPSKQKAA